MPFTPAASALGGVMLAFSTSSLLAQWGHILGVSGIAHPIVSDRLSPSKDPGPPASSNLWRLTCFSGFLVGGAVLRPSEARLAAFVGASVFDPPLGLPAMATIGRTALAGVLVGLGTKLGNGCTSGHMLCGLATLSYRSFIATCTFFGVALATAQFFPAILPPTYPTPSPQFTWHTLALLQLPAFIYTFAPRASPPSIAKPISTFFIGVHFAFGLAVAGMTRPSKVLSFFYFPFPFLPLAGKREWDPSLIMLAIGGLLPNILVWQKIKRWSRPSYGEKWHLPSQRGVDAKLVIGSALFGVGWGLTGICPGPAFTVLGSGNRELLVFAAAFVSGGALGNILSA